MSCKRLSLPWKAKLKISLFSFIVDVVLRPDGTLNRRVFSLADLKVRPDPRLQRGVRTADVTVDQARRLWFRLFLPGTPAPSTLQVVIYFHGGGFALLSAASRDYDALCRRLCRKLGVAVISVNYRLSPAHRFPAQYDDGVDVLRFLESNKASGFPRKEDSLLREFFNAADLSACFVAGDSAGGNIAHHVTRRWTAENNHQSLRLAGLIVIQPFFGGEARVDSEMRLQKVPLVNIERADWMWKAFLPGGATRDHPAASPAAAAENLGERFPPVMVMVGEFDPLQDWQRIYFQSLRKNGKEAEIIEYPGAIHGCYVLPELKASAAMIGDMQSFIIRCSPHRDVAV